jgi:hypothetical protein
MSSESSNQKYEAAGPWIQTRKKRRNHPAKWIDGEKS